MMRTFALLGLAVALVSVAQAGVTFGSGMSSAQAGRVAPGLHLGIANHDFNFGVFISGVQSPIYYQSSYFVGGYSLPKRGDFLWGQVRAGLGFAVSVSASGRRDGPLGEASNYYDYAAGPAVKVVWSVAGPLFVATEAMFGLRNFIHIILEFQQVAILSVGVRL